MFRPPPDRQRVVQSEARFCRAFFYVRSALRSARAMRGTSIGLTQ